MCGAASGVNSMFRGGMWVFVAKKWGHILTFDTTPHGSRCSEHRCPKCYTCPKTNRAFWDRKREANMVRDRHVTRQLRRQGWKVIRIWQLPSAVYAALRYQLVAAATYLRLRLRFSTPFPE